MLLSYSGTCTIGVGTFAPDGISPLPALPIALSPGYIADSKPIEDGLEEDPEMDPVDYVADEEDGSEIVRDSAVAAARQPELTLARGTKLNFMTALEEVKESVADMDQGTRQDSEEFLYASPGYAASTIGLIRAVVLHCVERGAETRALQQKRRDDHDMWTRAIGHIQTLEIARDPEHLDEPGDAVTVSFVTAIKPSTIDSQDVAWMRWPDDEQTEGSGKGHDSHDLGSGRKKTVPTALCAHIQGFLKLMFPGESDEVEKYVGGLPDILGNVMSAIPKTMQKAIELANDLMDQKVHTFVERQAENKSKLNSNPRDNQVQQQPFKRQNVARAYTVGPGEKKEYVRTQPLCTKCNYHHNCRSPAAANNQRAP
ncbi:hypothetical protein Tco_0938498 [Tanacetum coccineum]|uniref:Uncharacterized protein n=1 Tax=Tanacetum coccineum TaxID=301880 RepID=A0ABQ5DIB1_9ASTR